MPIYKKFPADLTLQGSHNTLINLGLDRGWKKDDIIIELPPDAMNVAKKTKEAEKR